MDRPSGGWFKLNFDGSKLSDGKASFGFVIRNHEGDVQLSGSMPLSGGCSILTSEAWGLREGLRAAKFLGISSLAIERDNLVVINSIRQCWKIPWEISSLIKDSAAEIQKFHVVSIDHCFREANQPAILWPIMGMSFLRLCIVFLLLTLSFLPSSVRML
ncbi:uncharacterized protein LOC130591181 [Beta vulgaris subsp. vulgaris]|uniref:uncharacterized protein LOC130591181 n=1 Tax=Beta vulgaris subsp. vulgaris TaxID=3555 RepID=UPI0025466F72|nr:uncharacterized protein LOC130591181 [Beta vulgaris subsp. vulgaris]